MFIICDFIDIISYVRQFTTQYKKQIYDLIEGKLKKTTQLYSYKEQNAYALAIRDFVLKNPECRFKSLSDFQQNL